MPTTYTSLLAMALPATGELNGQWGDVVNNYITGYVDASVAGAQIISGSQTTVTLSRTNGASLIQVGSGAGPSSGSSQYAVINCTGNPASTLTITVDVTATGSAPALSNATYSQTFAVINSTSTSQSVVVRATTSNGTSTGVTLASGEKALIAWNGSDFVKVATSAAGDVFLASNNAFTGANTFYNSTGQTFGTGTSTQDGIKITGRAGGSSSYRVTFTPTTLTANRTLTLPDTTGTVATVGTAVALSIVFGL